MADVSELITLGIGTPSSIPYFLTFGLGLGAPVVPPVVDDDGDTAGGGGGAGAAVRRNRVINPPRRIITTVWRLRPEPAVQLSEARGQLRWAEPVAAAVSEGDTSARARARWVVKLAGASAWQYHKTRAQMAIRYDAESYWRAKLMRQAAEVSDIAELMLLGVL